MVECLLECGHQVAAVDDLSTSKQENIPKGARLYIQDIRSLSRFSRHPISALWGPPRRPR
ncbi:MAG: hypothetical protein M3434_11360 [Gemmatimonadota bacterium]|nr:hypothetical protein [Gemmatimonadota bacterium]